MGSPPWTKFYWQDWLSDAGLRRCSFGARGLWMDMLCIAAQADPIGYLAVNGDALSTTDIARMVGGSETEVQTLIEELTRNGVLSRSRTGMIFSRRMVRDAKKARKARENGRNGGNPSLCGTKENRASDKGRVKAEVKPRDARDLEARYQNIREADASRGGAPPAEPLAATVFGPVLGYLLSHSGRPEAQCRSMLGKWRKAHGDGAVIEAAQQAQRDGKSDPFAAIEFNLGGRAHGQQRAPAGQRRRTVGDGFEAEILAGLGIAPH